MNLTEPQQRAIAEFPPALQALIHAELAAGNSIVEIGSGFPAPPAGACLKLAKKVATRPRAADDRIDFYERNISSHNGEFTDTKRFFFVLEPPDEPEPYPDMDAIRAGIEARQRAADAELLAMAHREARSPGDVVRSFFDENIVPGSTPLVKRFIDSMVMNHERWHDGIGYDLDVLAIATPEERAQIEDILLARQTCGWRDVEALCAIDSPLTRDKLRRAFESATLPLKIDLISHAANLFTDDERTEVLVAALREGERGMSITQVMLEVQDLHPPPVIEALLEGVRTHDGATAGQYAMMLLFIHGKAASPYDMEQRSFMLRFQSGDRTQMYRELCARIGAGPDRA